MKVYKILFLVFFLPSITTAQTRPYKEYDGRFEGQKDIQIAAPDFELISFMTFKEGVQSDKEYDLKIRFFVPDTQGITEVCIIARELEQSGKFYLMRLKKVDWQMGQIHEFASWPTKDVLGPLKISTNDIGIVGWLGKGEEGSGLVIPSVLYHSAFPDSIKKYHFHFRSKYTLDSLSFTIQDLNSKEIIKHINFSFISGQNTNYTSIRFEDLTEGFYKIIINGRRYDTPDTGPYREYTFYHRPTY